MSEDTINRSPTEPTDPESHTTTSEEEPIIAGTIFLTLIFLMMIFGFWTIMYVMLLNR